ncbi:MAG: CoA transferase [Alphaproteobacteria bacterium]|nr:CoA transferase [Alphaproteobacteria bacterium]
MTKALTGIRVLDLSRVLAGPWCTQMLGDLGAEIIKIEQPGKGDDTRSWGPPWHGAGEDRLSAYYLSANRNKKSVAIDISKPEGQALIRELATKCDVLVENFKVGGLDKYGLDYLSLKALNPRLVYCSITGFGHSGPRAHQPGYDLMVQGLSGLMSITGQPDGEPQKVGVALVDVMTGLHACIAVLAALNQRHETGRGQFIDMALLDVAVSTLANIGLNQRVTGEAPKRMGNAHPSVVPYQVFETADGHMIVAVGNDGQFAHFVKVLGLAALAVDPLYATNAGRVENRATLIPQLAAAMKTQTTAHWDAALSAANVPAGPINDIGQALADPQSVARGLATMAGNRPAIASPLRLSDSMPDAGSEPPLLGQNTAEVLQDVLGHSAADIAALKQRSVV